MMKCLAKDRYNDPCRRYTIDTEDTPTSFCKFHQYMNDYTPEMIESTQLCKGCKRMHYFTAEHKTCEPCRTRDKTKYKKPITKCEHPSCNFQKSPKNEYCGKHQLQLFVKATEALGKKVCYEHLRGCRSQMDASYTFSKCGVCLEKERTDDKERRHAAMKALPTIETNKICTVCCKEKDQTEFLCKDKNNIPTKTCQTCRSQNNVQNVNRNRPRRNLWYRTNLNNVLHNYKKDAIRRDIEFHLTKDEFMEIIKQKCLYCDGMSQEKQFNGIDRVDSTGHYTKDNCVSCCSLCNYLKHTMSVDVFFHRIEHVLTYAGKITGNLYPEAFSNIVSGNYDSFHKNAINRTLEFQLTEPEFTQIISNNCYLCGKEPNIKHRNGIDRFDNSHGYTIENARPCCSTCNLMKNRFPYEDMIKKFEQIYAFRIRT